MLELLSPEGKIALGNVNSVTSYVQRTHCKCLPEELKSLKELQILGEWGKTSVGVFTKTPTS